MVQSRKVRCRLLIIGLCWLLAPTAGMADGAFHVVVSIKPIHSILAGLMAGAGTPELLIDKGQTPYDFTLSEQQKRDLTKANLVVWVGPELEASLVKPLAKLKPPVQVLQLLDDPALKVLPSRVADDRRDPYFWLDDRNAIILLDDLAEILEQEDPARAHIYQRNRRKMLQQLGLIDREYEYGYRGMKAGLAVEYYDTLQYFEQAYALSVVDHLVESPRQRVSAASLLRVRKRIGQGDVVCILTEKGLPTDNLELLTQGRKINVGVLDSLGTGIPAGPNLYVELMDRNTDTIKRCLNADMQQAAKARLAAQKDRRPIVDRIGEGRFVLMDQFGHEVTQETMRGKFQLLYFGYTFCPDVCPNTLQVMSQALDQLGDLAQQVQPYFITIDPERDTQSVMRDYVKHFDPRLIGLTGPPAMIEDMAAHYKVRYEKVVEEGGDPHLYLMNHSAAIYLMAPDGRFLHKYLYGIQPATLAKELAKAIRQYHGAHH